MGKKKYDELPLVYSCSGCSNIAQLANKVAVELDREHIAEMSCIAGVGGGVKSLVKKAKSGREIISLDGCHLNCVVNCLAQHKIEPTHQFTLSAYGIKKKNHVDFSPSDVINIKNIVINSISK